MEEPKDTSVDINETTENKTTDEVVPDITVTDTGSVEENVAEVNEDLPQSPEVTGDVTPPPHDEVVHEEPEPSAEADVDSSEIKVEPGHDDDTVTPDEQKQHVVLPTGADPDVVHKEMHEGNSKGAVIGIIVVLALVLATIVVLIFMKTNNTAKDSSKTEKTQQQTTTLPTKVEEPVTVTEVDTTTKEVDEALSALDDNKDFNTDDLSDKALGLQ